MEDAEPEVDADDDVAEALLRVDAARELAERDPVEGASALLLSIGELIPRYRAAERLQEARSATGAVVDLLRTYERLDPDRARLADALLDHRQSLIDINPDNSTVELSREALSLRREGAGDTPSSALAFALLKHGADVQFEESVEESVVILVEAAAIYRGLTPEEQRESADSFLRALDRLQRALSILRRYEECLVVARESLAVARSLSEPRGAEVVRALADVAMYCALLDHEDEAHARREEALPLIRELFASDPEAHVDTLDRLLKNHAASLARLKRPGQAVTLLLERTELLERKPPEQQREYADELLLDAWLLALTMRSLDLGPDLAVPERGWVALARRFQARWPDGYTVELAKALVSLARQLRRQGQLDDSLAHLSEAEALLRDTVRTKPALAPDLADTLLDRGRVLWKLERFEESFAVQHEGLALKRCAPLDDEERSMFVVNLQSVSGDFSSIERHDKALEFLEEALENQTRLAEGGERKHRSDLADLQLRLADTFCEIGQFENAQAAAHEAIEICRSLVADCAEDDPADPEQLARYREDLEDARTFLKAILEEANRNNQDAGTSSEHPDRAP